MDEREAELFGLPLGEFVAARDALAKERRAAGDRDAAARVKQLRKPPLPVWAVNQLARRDRPALQALVDAAERLVLTQRAALHAAPGGDVLRASAALQQAVDDLTRRARGVLADSGAGTSDATLDRVAVTLRGAATDPVLRPALLEGRLTDVPEAGDVDLFALAAEGPPPPTAEPEPERPDEVGAARVRRRRRQLEERAEAAERRAAARRRDAETAQRTADDALRAATEADRSAANLEEQARRARKTAGRRARDAEGAVEKAERAQADADEAAREAEEARENLAVFLRDAAEAGGEGEGG